MASQSASKRNLKHITDALRPHNRSDNTIGIAMTRASVSSPSVGKCQRVSPLSVIVCTYERYAQLAYAIEALIRQDMECEIIVVDNSQDQKRAAQFKKRYDDQARVQYVLQPKRGLSLARNTGTILATSARVAFIDDDAVPAADWASSILATFDTFGPLTGVVGGRVVPRWLCEQPAWLDERLLGYLSLVDWGDIARELMPSEWLAGCNIAFDKATLQAVGGFSESLGRLGDLMLLSNEEINVIAKVRTVGAKIIYAPQAVVEHLIDPSRLTVSWFRRRAAWQAVSDYIHNPEGTAQYSRTAIERLKILQKSVFDDENKFLPPSEKAEMYALEINLMYDLMVAALSGEIARFDEGPCPIVTTE